MWECPSIGPVADECPQVTTDLTLKQFFSEFSTLFTPPLKINLMVYILKQ